MPTTTIRVKGVKVVTLVDPKVLMTPGLVPPDGQPAGSPILVLELEGSPLVIHAMLNGKSVRRALKTIAEHGVDGVNVVLQGNLKPGLVSDGPYVLDCAGLTVSPKSVKAGEA